MLTCMCTCEKHIKNFGTRFRKIKVKVLIDFLEVEEELPSVQNVSYLWNINEALINENVGETH